MHYMVRVPGIEDVVNYPNLTKQAACMLLDAFIHTMPVERIDVYELTEKSDGSVQSRHIKLSTVQGADDPDSSGFWEFISFDGEIVYSNEKGLI